MGILVYFLLWVMQDLQAVRSVEMVFVQDLGGVLSKGQLSRGVL